MKSHTLKLFLLISIVLLSACETQPPKPEPQALEEERPLLTSQQTILTEQAEKWLVLARGSEAIEQQLTYRALAASAFIEADKIHLAKRQLDKMKQAAVIISTKPLTDAQTAQASISLLSAEIAIAEKNAALAHQILNTIEPGSREQQITLFALKADLDFLAGQYMSVVNRRVQLGNSLFDAEKINRNNEKIWAALSSLLSPQLNKQHSDNLTTQGWLALAKVMRSGQQNIHKLEDDLLDWGTRYPLHPVGAIFLSQLLNNYQLKISERKQIAVILPMHGNLSKITDTIINGLLSAYYLNAETSDTKPLLMPVIKFYDSSSQNKSFQQLYQQAVDEGATNIIGPLNKDLVSQLVLQGGPSIPVLTLNYSEHRHLYTDNLFQFGLSPIDEAQQVAELAIRQNKFSAAVFYPDSGWGRRLMTAFTEHYEALGGKVVSKADYATNTNDYSRSIRALLNLDQSTIRRRRVENIISQKTQSEPHRRQDIDMIFLVATHHSARGIMPALKFHHAGELPVYSTSHVYSGVFNRELDSDLNGLVFCDQPWILQNTSTLADVFTQNWPQQESLTRFFALGVDAYHLIYNLEYLQNVDYAFYHGQTGNIQLDENNRITRQLLWARFERGRAVHFEPVLAEPSLTELSHLIDRPEPARSH